jgi:putative transposase
MAVEARRDPATAVGPVRRVAGQLGVHPVAVEFIDEHKDEFGGEPICAVLAGTPARIAPSTYYARKSRPPSRRSVTDAETTRVIRGVHEENYGVYGQIKMHAELARVGGVQGRSVARCTVARLMRAAGLRGITRTLAGPRTTRAKDEAERPADLVHRDFTATGPNQVWVADIACVRTFSGGCTRRSSSTCSPAASSAGNSPDDCTPIWRWTPCRWRSGPAPETAPTCHT